MEVKNILALTLNQLKKFYRINNLAVMREKRVFRPNQGPLVMYLQNNNNWGILNLEGPENSRCLACVVDGKYVEPGKLKPSQAKKMRFEKETIDSYNAQEIPPMTLESELDDVKPVINPFVPKLDISLSCNLVEGLMYHGELPIEYFRDDKEVESTIGVLSPGFRVISVTSGPGEHTLYNESSIVYDKIRRSMPIEFKPELIRTHSGKHFWLSNGAFMDCPYQPAHIDYKVKKSEVMISVARLGTKVSYVLDKKSLKLKAAFFF